MDSVRTQGPLKSLIKAAKASYDLVVRPRLPRKYILLNGLRAPAGHIGDSLVPWHSVEMPGYESGIIASIQNHIEQDDDIVIVGGGYGVSAVKSGASTDGWVKVFEAGEDHVKIIQETAKRNDVYNVSVTHAAVGSIHDVLSSAEQAEMLYPSDLPECDVLILDCEGSERDIIPNLSVSPRLLIVESHGQFDSPPEMVQELLEKKEYGIVDIKVANKDKVEYCERNGVKVFTALRQ